ncbi:hypothetical protein [Micrococcus sp.]|uniref:hypothetical protein n=1 Tax=Micrococcus sp. TaxID=1271 RepID=UPI0026DA85FB|nr:hypothetical protein [Micrococcus sp.]MDO4239302.1 hypothetical protein [Micrococcus sp.]
MRPSTTRRPRTSPAPDPTPADARAIVLGAAAVAVALWPLRAYRGPHLSGASAPKFALDSFPLSTYPMFSEHRGDSARVPHVIGLTAAGDRVIPHYRHFGQGGLNQTRKQVARAIRRGDAAVVAQDYADSLARQNAALGGRVPTGSGPGSTRRRREAAIATVEVVRSRFRFSDHLEGRNQPYREQVLARCEVGGTAQAVQERRAAHQIPPEAAR